MMGVSLFGHLWDLAKAYRQIARAPKRASYEKEVIYPIIEECIIGHLAFKTETGIHSIPMPFWHIDDDLYCHCSIQSRLSQLAKENNPVCISFTILDGFVLSKSALHHSMNYRSVVVYGQFELVKGEEKKRNILKGLVDLVDDRRWDLVRRPSRKELNACAVLRMSLDEAVAKVRIGPADELKKDLSREVWTGVVPVLHARGIPEPDENCRGSTA